jgi:superfamily II DNA/RNA helicase
VLITTDLFPPLANTRFGGLVINFDLPTDRDNYIHRIDCNAMARCPRGASCVNFITVGDEQYVDDIKDLYRTEINDFTENPDYF